MTETRRRARSATIFPNATTCPLLDCLMSLIDSAVDAAAVCDKSAMMASRKSKECSMAAQRYYRRNSVALFAPERVLDLKRWSGCSARPASAS